MRWNDPSRMNMSPSNGKRSNTLNEILKKRSMRKGPLVLKTSKTNLMPQDVRNIYLAIGMLKETIHEINTIPVAGPFVTHLGIDGADDTLIDNERRSLNRYLIEIFLLFHFIKLSNRLEKEATNLNVFGSMIWVRFMNFETSVRKPKSCNKLSISGGELGVRSHPGDGLVRTKETCGVKLMASSEIVVMVKSKWSSKTEDSMSLMAPGYFTG